MMWLTPMPSMSAKPKATSQTVTEDCIWPIMLPPMLALILPPVALI